MNTILVTGGAGFIGSHTCVELLQKGFFIILVDNFCNSQPEVLGRIEALGGGNIISYTFDLLESAQLEMVFSKHKIDAVIHFAGLKAVGESTQTPIKYYKNNLLSTVNLLEVMAKFEVFNLVFSSSATVYGENNSIPYKENFPLSSTSPYGRTKVMSEEIIQDASKAELRWNVAILRYFNPVGAHPSGLIGENPNGVPNNLMPYITQVAIGKIDVLNIFGNDYPTADGTGMRDYIHVVDLAKGHLKALNKLLTQITTGVEAYNLGMGSSFSVLTLVKSFERASGKSIPYNIVPRREGDIAEFYANTDKAFRLLGWKAELDLDHICQDSWRWQRKNPNGYDS